MAISAYSSTSSFSALPAVGPLVVWAKVGRVAPVFPVEAVFRDIGEGAGQAAVQGSEDSTPAEGLSPPALDRRSAESILGRDRIGRPGQGLGPSGAAAVAAGAKDAKGLRKADRSQIEDRLAQLEGEKGAKEREKASSSAGKNAEVAAVIAQLKTRDGEVRAHEAAHIAAGGRYITGGASYSYQRGPDGGSYAIGGEVGIDSSPVPGKPEETIAKMTIVRAAALAPADPSGADLSVAGAAAQAMAQAMAEIADGQAKSTVPGSKVDLVA